MRAAWTREMDDWARPEIGRLNAWTRRRASDEATARRARGRVRGIVHLSRVARDSRFRSGLGGDVEEIGRAAEVRQQSVRAPTTSDVLRHASSCVNFETRDVRAVVYYCGSNDISLGVGAKTVCENCVEFTNGTRAKAEDGRRCGVVFVGVIDSPQKRMFGMSDAVRETNALCRAWCEKTPVMPFTGPRCLRIGRVVSRRRDAFEARGVRSIGGGDRARRGESVAEVLDERVKDEFGKGR